MTKPSDTSTTERLIAGVKKSNALDLSGLSEVAGSFASQAKKPSVPRKASVDALQPDPSQPRKSIDTDELNGLAASVKANGVLSAIGVLTAENGVHTIVFGERRWRAAKLAGLSEVPITIVDPSKVNLRAVQLVENIQRSRLSAEEIAAAIDDLAGGGMKAAQIAAQLGMTKSRVSEFRSVMDMPPCIRAHLNQIGAQTAYQLFGLWRKDKAAVEDFLATTAAEDINRQAVARLAETFNRKDAADLPEAVASEPTGSVSTAPGSPPPSSDGASMSADADGEVNERGGGKLGDAAANAGSRSQEAAPRAVVGEQNGPSAPVFIVQVGDEHGRLLIDRSGPDSKTALVSFNNGGEIRPVALSELTIFEIV